jgi:serine protease Do
MTGGRMGRGWSLPALSLLFLVVAPGTGCTQTSTLDANDARQITEDLQPQSSPAGVGVQDAVTASRRNAIVVAAERVSPAVVSVNVVRRERVVPRSIFEEMMLPPGAERETAGLGSGFIIHDSGLVITNEHVIRGADDVLVTLPDGREFDANVIGVDEVSDLAVLRIVFPDGGIEALPVAALGDSDGLMIGEWVIAIGNPLGFLLANTEPSVTAGVISAVGRNITPSSDQRSYYLDMVQTDASINPGNSGGPLINALGEVIGVNSSILSTGGGSEGLGFAIPINRARRIVEDLLEDGRVRRAWVGAGVEANQAAGRRAAEVRLAGVLPGSPAARAGLRDGMVVRNLGGKIVRTPLDWEAGLLAGRVGEPISIEVTDGSGARSFRVVPEDLPSVSADRIQALRDIELVTLTPAIRAERGLTSEQGALIVTLAEAARQTGLREGDVIVQINRSPIRTAEEAASALRQLAGRGVAIYFERNGQLLGTSFRIG